MQDTVSVIIPAYNGAQVLGRALASVDAQTHPPDEIIVVDDGSPEPMEPVVSSFVAGKRSLADVRYIRQTNTGVAGARNRGIQEARGTWIAFLDQDDEWLPPHLDRQLGLARGQRANFVAGDCCIRGLEGPPQTFLDLAGFRSSFDSDPPGPVVADFFDRLLCYGCFFMPSTVLASRQLLLSQGGFDPQLSGVDDYEFWMRLAPVVTVAWGDQPSAARWIHDNNVSSDHARMSRQHLPLWEKMARADAVRYYPHRARRVRRKLAQSHFDCAYYGLQDGRADLARRHLAASMRLRPTLPVAAHLLFECLPATPRRLWRRWRQTGPTIASE